jgi:hypothetical protein
LVDRIVLAEPTSDTEHPAGIHEDVIVVCQRGSKVASTQPAVLDANGASWSESLDMISTMYKVQGHVFREKVRTQRRSSQGVHPAGSKLQCAWAGGQVCIAIG